MQEYWLIQTLHFSIDKMEIHSAASRVVCFILEFDQTLAEQLYTVSINALRA